MPSSLIVALALALPLAGIADRVRAADAPRVVEFTPDTEAREVSTYYSLHAHGPTVKFYVFPEACVVAVVRVTPAGKAIDTAVDVAVFPRDTAVESIQKWINNQHSDAIYPDVPNPERRFTVDGKWVHATSKGPLEHEVGGNGDEYDRHEVEFAIDAFTEGDVDFRASRGTANAFVRTKDIEAPEPGIVPSLPR